MHSAYDIAQICTNGHLITGFATTSPENKQPFCELCGAPTITTCPSCEKEIRGVYLDYDNSWRGLGFRPPNYCLYCGKPFPWTALRLTLATELATEQNSLSTSEQSQLVESIDILVRETPAVPLAAARFKRLMAKIGAEGASMFRDILVDILSETIQKSLFP